jgi:lipopolysaccharide/colanic/teichoic acid biosynthesis glycosyltransferase
MLALAIAIRVSSPGPAIFRQLRQGQGQVPFEVWKFRTMRVDMEGLDLTMDADRRVTPLGHFLRASSLDELPQLANILRGDMTLVGPRPETVSLADRYPEPYAQIFQYRPGLTGPVQVHQRDLEIPDSAARDVEAYYLLELVPRRVALDMEYLNDPSLPRTFGVILETALQIVSSGARSARKRPAGAVGTQPGVVPEAGGR